MNISANIKQARAVYVASSGYEDQLRGELHHRGLNIVFEGQGLFATTAPPHYMVWADNIWLEPMVLEVPSISAGARALKAWQRNWWHYPFAEHRRAALMTEQLPKVSAKPLHFGDIPPAAPLGSWCLLSRDKMLASAKCSSIFPGGQVNFVEDKINPPNRAYLKLWEGFTRLGLHPGPGELCLDLGSSPGGWSWVLAECGAKVFSVDKAPLAKHISRHPNVEYCQGSAFALDPKQLGNVDWLFSDVACYPERLYDLVTNFVAHIPHLKCFCTIKLAGQTDFAVIDRFLGIPHSQIIHLCANKHEVTWIHLPK